MRITPVPATSDRQTVTSSAVTFDTTMASGEFWVFTTSVAAYIKQGSAPTASAADGSTLIGAGQSCLIEGVLGAKLSVIYESIDGVATLTRAKVTG